MNLADEAGQGLVVAAVGQREGAARTGDGHVEEAALLENRVLVLLLGEHLVIHSDQKHVVPLQAFGTVKSRQIDCLLARDRVVC